MDSKTDETTTDLSADGPFLMIESYGAKAITKAINEKAAEGWDVVSYQGTHLSSGESGPFGVMKSQNHFSVLLRRRSHG